MNACLIISQRILNRYGRVITCMHKQRGPCIMRNLQLIGKEFYYLIGWIFTYQVCAGAFMCNAAVKADNRVNEYGKIRSY